MVTSREKSLKSDISALSSPHLHPHSLRASISRKPSLAPVIRFCPRITLIEIQSTCVTIPVASGPSAAERNSNPSFYAHLFLAQPIYNQHRRTVTLPSAAALHITGRNQQNISRLLVQPYHTRSILHISNNCRPVKSPSIPDFTTSTPSIRQSLLD
ncbi:hypothetical protein VTL71DRAFT_8512 [Oculimacula yallundae]|uniref:Uncharacterized protein n=1 Tax=Oculimacula yallundae TaxID=86028 RepID=A0ABR4CXU7_9HELO